MSILDYPETKCYTCGGNTWWYAKETHPGTDWICGTCHPPAGRKEIAKMRIIKGNYLMNKMRREISAEEFLVGVRKLKDIWNDIGAPADCLYTERGKKLKKCLPALHGQRGIECYTCLNDYWWSVEVWDVDKEKHPEAHLND
jgi:hypothetical protein